MKLSWVQAWRSSLSLPEVAISLSPGLISLNHTHLPLITLLSCSSSSWTIYTPHSRPSAWLNCICEFVCLCDQHAGDTCTVLLFYVSQLPNCLVFLAVLAFLLFIKAFFPCIWTQTLINGDLSHLAVTEFSQQAWIQQGEQCIMEWLPAFWRWTVRFVLQPL